MSQPIVTLDFFKAKELLEKEIPNEEYQFGIEKEETNFRYKTISSSKGEILDAIGIIKNYIENFRVYTVEEGYLSLQTLSDNLFEPEKNLSSRLRIRFLYKSDLKIEFSKRGEYNFKEIQALISLVRFFSQNKSETKKDPRGILTKLGAEVYDPHIEEAKGNVLDFSSVFGYESVKSQILESLVFPLRNPEPFFEITKFTRLKPTNILPRAVLLEGEPGVGKTTMAKIASHLCQIPMVYVPIESILSKYYGESSQNLAMVFDAVSLFPQAMLFLDEIDSLATSRDDGMFEATRNVLGVLLRKLDGFAGRGGTITIGATNRREDLDKALLSRFDRKIYFPLPSEEERAQILEGYAKHLPWNERKQIAERLPGASGRNLRDFCDYVERRWITARLGKETEVGIPGFAFYLESLPEFRWKP